MCVMCLKYRIIILVNIIISLCQITNAWVLEKIKPEWTLESRVAQAALRYFGHVVREEHGMENGVMLGEVSWKRRRGRPRTRWLDNVNNIKGLSINSMRWDPTGEVLPWLSAGVGHDSTVQGDNAGQILLLHLSNTSHVL